MAWSSIFQFIKDKEKVKKGKMKKKHFKAKWGLKNYIKGSI